MQSTKKTSWVLERVWTWTRSARCAGGSGYRDYPHQGELVVNADIEGFFHAIRHEWLMRFVELPHR